jgi:murein L,D-transpeptidase YcbB/YkuD
VFKAFLPALAIFAVAWSSLADTPAKPATPAKTAKPHKRRHTVSTASSTHASSHTAVATKAAPAKTTKPKTAQAKTTKAVAHRKGKSAPRPSRSRQQAPSPERYKEIQQALATKGYLPGEPTGQWGPDSVDALKRFQTDQSLMPDGKINSLSLIALGLGPKRLSAKSDSAPLPAPPQ